MIKNVKYIKIMALPKKLEFLSSTRFWALVVGAVFIYLKTKNLIGEAELVLANTILGGFIVIKTVDKAGENIGGGNKN